MNPTRQDRPDRGPADRGGFPPRQVKDGGAENSDTTERDSLEAEFVGHMDQPSPSAVVGGDDGRDDPRGDPHRHEDRRAGDASGQGPREDGRYRPPDGGHHDRPDRRHDPDSAPFHPDLTVHSALPIVVEKTSQWDTSKKNRFCQGFWLKTKKKTTKNHNTSKS